MPRALIDTKTGEGILADETGHEIPVAFEIDTYGEMVATAGGASRVVPASRQRRGRILARSELALARFLSAGRLHLVFEDGRRLPVTLKDENLSRWVTLEALGDFE